MAEFRQDHLSIHKRGEEYIIHAKGDLGITSCDALQGHICDALDSGVREICIDMSQVDNLSSAGVGIFMEMIDEVNRRDANLKFTNLQDCVRTVLQTLNMMLKVRDGEQGEELRPAVLIVDDDSECLAILNLALKDTDCEVLLANSSEEALNVLADNPTIFLVIADWCMPGRDGICLLKEINEQYPWIERILLTGVQVGNTAIQALESGVTSKIVTKPWPVSKFTGTVEAILQSARKKSTRITRKSATDTLNISDSLNFQCEECQQNTNRIERRV